MPLYSIEASFARDGFYIVTPTDAILSDCAFVEAASQPSLGELQRLADGYIECVNLNTNPRTVGIVDEEGKMKRKPRNGLATVLLDSPSDFIVGTMLVMCGKAVVK